MCKNISQHMVTSHINNAQYVELQHILYLQMSPALLYTVSVGMKNIGLSFSPGIHSRLQAIQIFSLYFDIQSYSHHIFTVPEVDSTLSYAVVWKTVLQMYVKELLQCKEVDTSQACNGSTQQRVSPCVLLKKIDGS